MSKGDEVRVEYLSLEEKRLTKAKFTYTTLKHW